MKRHAGAPSGVARAPRRSAPSRARPAIARHSSTTSANTASASSRRGRGFFPRGVRWLKLAAAVLAAALVGLAILNNQDSPSAVSGFEPSRNETVIYRHATPRKLDARVAPGDAMDYAAPSNYPRTVQTVRFVNTDPQAVDEAAAETARGSAWLPIAHSIRAGDHDQGGRFRRFLRETGRCRSRSGRDCRGCRACPCHTLGQAWIPAPASTGVDAGSG